jgi:hypothetical protein
VRTDNLTPQLRMHAWEFPLEKDVQSLKGGGIERGGIFVRDGRDADGPSEPLGCTLTHSHLRYRSNPDLIRPVTQRSNEHNGDDQHNYGAEK